MLVKLSQLKNASAPIEVTPSGMTTLTSESQLTNVTTSTYGAYCAWVISNVPKYVSSEQISAEEVAKALAHTKAVAVLDKADSLNAAGGALFEDVVSGMYTNGINVPTVNYVYGIGGRDTTVEDLEKVYTDLQKIAESGKIENIFLLTGYAFYYKIKRKLMQIF